MGSDDFVRRVHQAQNAIDAAAGCDLSYPADGLGRLEPIGWYGMGSGLHFLPGKSELDLPPGWTFVTGEEEEED